MSQTATSLADVLREAWTSNRIQKQFFDENQPLDRFEKFSATMIGKQAQVPIHKGRSGGYTSFGAGGGLLNAAGNQAVDQALYTLVNHGFQIELEFSALNQAGGSSVQSMISSKNLEIEGAIADMRKQCCRQAVTNGDGKIAQCDTGGASTSIELLASPSGTAYGYDAIVRGWLYPGLLVDIGATSNTDSIVTGEAIVDVKEVDTDPDIIMTSSLSTTSGTDFVYIANPNSATAANPETNGLRNIVNISGALGGLDPANAGESFWKASARDTTTSVLSIDLALSLQRGVMQKSGKVMSDVWTSLKQQANFYSLLQNQVRFAGELNMGAGNVDSPTWNNMKINGYQDILDADWYCLTLSDFVLIHGAITKPTWASDLAGQSGLPWKAGSTAFSDAVFYSYQIGVQRRNTHAAATALTA